MLEEPGHPGRVSILGGGAVYPDDLNEAAENFRVMLKNM